MPKVPEFPVKLVYGVFPPEDIKVPEFIKDDPKKGKISLLRLSVLKNFLKRISPLRK